MFIKIILYCGIIMFFSSCLDKYTQYGIVNIPCPGKDGKYINCLVAESDATVTMENGGYNKTTYETTYWLKQYETATGKLTQKKMLVPSSSADNVSINCFGVLGNTIWLYVNGIRGFDINSLDEITNEEKIAAANGMKKTVFPYDERLVYPAVDKGFIDFIADNDEQYRLQLKNLKILNKKELKDDTPQKTNHLRHEDDYGVRCDTMGNNVFVFAKNEAAVNDARPGNYKLEASAYRVKLFKGNYTLSPLGDHQSFSYQNITQVSNDTYLNPCFAVNTSSYSTIHLSNPYGFLLIELDTLVEKSKAIISRIDTNGKKLWQTAAGVSTKIESCIMTEKYLIITTNKDYMLSPHIGKDALCLINTENGNLVKAFLNE